MAWYFFYQCSEQQPWQVALASDRERIVSEIKPFLVSVLDVDYSFQQDLSAEESLKLKYLGPAYFDFDCGEGQTVADVIPPVKEFLTNLRGKGVDLDSLRIFATGGKGFHVEMPLETVKEKIPKTGITALPYVIREIANELYCDTMDMRVYTGRKGRLWRTPNILRPNGKYKVPITAAEVFEMTAESYAEICSAPRQFTALSSPTFSPTLGLLCHLAEEKVAKSLKARKQGKTDINLVKRFNGDWPASVKKILGGDGLADGVGFQRIALQLGIVANSLGKQEKDLLRDSEGLCDKHQSDGTRYNTFRKRQNELSRMFRYIAGNPCFSFEVGPLKALLRPEEDTSDLVGGEKK